ncbi:MAG: S-methyl-5-thioribose-1-phosphate isomerase, partial [Pirellulales bacterium]|nr:S-methyl-5-thioribose-1-phosphate isomerase [Pirellulales bacterium]
MTTGPPPTLRWSGGIDGHLRLLDQTQLPGAVVEQECHCPEDVWGAIRALQVRGAPAIGIAAAYGVVLGARPFLDGHLPVLAAAARKAADLLATSRPTAVNLFWALDRMRKVADIASTRIQSRELAERLLAEAEAIHNEDRQQCAAMGQHGAKLLSDLPDPAGILTHCNTGALATGGDGTALAVLFALHAAGKAIRVYADETRPLLQGARLTAWELLGRGIDATLICDSMAAQLMYEGRVDAVVVGADRIAANGDVANKIGTYGLA